MPRMDNTSLLQPSFPMDHLPFIPLESLAELLPTPSPEGRLPRLVPDATRRHMLSPEQANNRRWIVLETGGEAFIWQAPELSTLFRGSIVPPSLEQYPKEYVPLFAHVEEQVFHRATELNAGRDDEFREIYSNLRRLPDGKSATTLHASIWQILALTLASTPISQAQFEAVVQRIAQSARSQSMGPSSRNYLAYLAKIFSPSPFRQPHRA